MEKLLRDAFAVVDIETTGGRALQDRIIEIGIVFVENDQIVDRWQSFVNPERKIPSFITRLTGIDDLDIADAPTFDELATDLMQRLEGKVFVAHNMNFYYSFIKHAFKRIGIAYTPKKLCTVKLSRKFIPELRRHSLAVVSKYLQIA